MLWGGFDISAYLIWSFLWQLLWWLREPCPCFGHYLLLLWRCPFSWWLDLLAFLWLSQWPILRRSNLFLELRTSGIRRVSTKMLLVLTTSPARVEPLCTFFRCTMLLFPLFTVFISLLCFYLLWIPWNKFAVFTIGSELCSWLFSFFVTCI